MGRKKGGKNKMKNTTAYIASISFFIIGWLTVFGLGGWQIHHTISSISMLIGIIFMWKTDIKD